MDPASVPLGDRLGQTQKVLSPIGEPRAIAFDAAGPRLLEQLDGERDEARVPIGDMSRVEGNPMEGRPTLDPVPYVARVREMVLLPPCPGELDARNVRRRALYMERPCAHIRGQA